MGVPAWWHDRVDRAFLYALHYRKHIPDIDAVPHIDAPRHPSLPCSGRPAPCTRCSRSEEHTSELQSLMRISYAVFCLKKKKITNSNHIYPNTASKYINKT